MGAGGTIVAIIIVAVVAVWIVTKVRSYNETKAAHNRVGKKGFAPERYTHDQSGDDFSEYDTEFGSEETQQWDARDPQPYVRDPRSHDPRNDPDGFLKF